MRLLGVWVGVSSERALRLRLFTASRDPLRCERLLAAIDTLRARGLPIRPDWFTKRRG